MMNETIMSRSIQETLRIINTRKAERQYGKQKLGYRYEFVDIEARNAFNSKNVTNLSYSN